MPDGFLGKATFSELPQEWQRTGQYLDAPHPYTGNRLWGPSTHHLSVLTCPSVFTSLFHPRHMGHHFSFLKVKSSGFRVFAHAVPSAWHALPWLLSLCLMSPLLRGPCLAIIPKAGVSFLSLWRLPLGQVPRASWPLSRLKPLLVSRHHESRADPVSPSLIFSGPGTQ